MSCAKSPPLTLFEKIWRDHAVATLSGTNELVLIDRVFLHERTGAVALEGLAAASRGIAHPRQVFCTMDHVVDTLPGRGDQTLMPTGSQFITATRAACRRNNVTLFDVADPRQGIVHVISPEQGIVLPGLTLVCPDSHTATQGALGALAWGIGSTEAEHALATGTLRVAKPGTLRISIASRLPEGTTAKDLALHIIQRLSTGGGKGRHIEFEGSAVSALSVEGRMTLCNMAAELSAFGATIAPDEKTFAYLHGRPHAPKAELWSQACAYWRTLRSDEGAVFDQEADLDAADVTPMVTWGTSPQQAAAVTGRVPAYEAAGSHETRDAFERALRYMDLRPGDRLQDVPIDAAFIGSCTNSRIEDLRAAAKILEGKRVKVGVKAICVPGSRSVKAAAEAEGLDRIFKSAGFEWRDPGCSMCFFAGGESFGLRERVITSTNRNFESRQGPQTRSHLASPQTVAASAVAGCIADPRQGTPT